VGRLPGTRAVSQFCQNRLYELLSRLATAGVLDSQRLYFETTGILQYQDHVVSGERYALQNVLPKYFTSNEPVVYDVGANRGDFTEEVLAHFPNARVVAFEPHPATFRKLSARLSTLSAHATAHNVGLSSSVGDSRLYDYELNDGSIHASHYSAVLTDLRKEKRITSHCVPVTTLDDFCRSNGIQWIDFLKIDTEGHELEVLRGAAGLLSAQKIGIVQFEFNETNIISRTFLKDFYQILKKFDFYRLSRDRLIVLGEYSSRYEIFMFQNILAIRRDLRHVDA
jgi:FkbM family methyltransferase